MGKVKRPIVQAAWEPEARRLYDAQVPLPEIAKELKITGNQLRGVKVRRGWPQRAMDEARQKQKFKKTNTGRPRRIGAGSTLAPLPSLADGAGA